jgi:hypothetical protein
MEIHVVPDGTSRAEFKPTTRQVCEALPAVRLPLPIAAAAVWHHHHRQQA